MQTSETANLASRWKRLGGFLIDSLFLFVIIAPILLATGIAGRLAGMTLVQRALVVAAGWIVFLALNGYMLLKRGQTLGKLAMGTCIVDVNGKIPGFGRIFVVRYLIPGLVSYIPVIGFIPGVAILLIFGKERRCFHDYLAGTRVINVVDQNHGLG